MTVNVDLNRKGEPRGDSHIHEALAISRMMCPMEFMGSVPMGQWLKDLLPSLNQKVERASRSSAKSIGNSSGRANWSSIQECIMLLLEFRRAIRQEAPMPTDCPSSKLRSVRRDWRSTFPGASAHFFGHPTKSSGGTDFIGNPVEQYDTSSRLFMWL